MLWLESVATSRISVERPKIPSLLDYKDQPSENSSDEMMSAPRLSIKATTNPMDFLMDTGNPTLNCTLDGVLKISGVGAAHAASQEAYSLMRKGIELYRSSSQIHSIPIEHAPTARRDLEKIIVKAGKEGLQWGMVAGMYAGFEYGMEKARGKQDWVIISCWTLRSNRS